jgi:predicted metalloprotease with PDZ domain
MRNCAIAILAILLPLTAGAQNSAPVALPIADTIPAPRDVPCPGVIRLSVDVSDITRAIYQCVEAIPVPSPGPLTLLYPKWIPGEHTDDGPIIALAGLEISDGRNSIPWRRDPVDVYAFHLDVPTGVRSITARYQFLAPTAGSQGRIITTPEMLNLEWHTVVLYPAGYYVRRIMVDPTVTIPDGWKSACALDIASQRGATIHYQQVALDTLVDSPLFAGVNFRGETLGPGVRLNIFADKPKELAATAEQIQFHRNLVTQAVKLFGAQHYDHYDFLMALSDVEGGIGLEHHRSSEDGTTGTYFTDWKGNVIERDLLPHEYTHSWNGKFRRPADLWTPDYRTPMQDTLLWVYEGQTQFWGYVLGARSGVLSKDETLGAIADFAAYLETYPGRKWRPLQDTTEQPIMDVRDEQGWPSWQRSYDYYDEGVLIWLDADRIIRERSHGARSMDDFARGFFGMNDRDWGELTYTFDDVVAALNNVQPYDWAGFLHARLDKVSNHAPLDGITRGGYRLVYTDTPTDWETGYEKERKMADLIYSGGFRVSDEGEVTRVVWDSPAFNAGLTVGDKIIAVNGHALDLDDLKDTLKAKTTPLQLLIKAGDIYRTVDLNYDGGLRYPKLEKTGTGPGTLDALLAPRP